MGHPGGRGMRSIRLPRKCGIGSRSIRTRLREMNVAKKSHGREFYVEGQFMSCRAGEPVYVGHRFSSGEDQGWCNGDLGGHLYRAWRGWYARFSNRVEQIRQEDWQQGTG